MHIEFGNALDVSVYATMQAHYSVPLLPVGRKNGKKCRKNGSGLAYCINMLPEKCSQNCVNFASDQEAPLDPEAPLPAKCC